MSVGWLSTRMNNSSAGHDSVLALTRFSANFSNHSSAGGGHDSVFALGESTVQIVLLHALGYAAVAHGPFSSGDGAIMLQGLGTFVRAFALPALLFEVAMMDLEPWSA